MGKRSKRSSKRSGGGVQKKKKKDKKSAKSSRKKKGKPKKGKSRSPGSLASEALAAISSFISLKTQAIAEAITQSDTESNTQSNTLSKSNVSSHPSEAPHSQLSVQDKNPHPPPKKGQSCFHLQQRFLYDGRKNALVCNPCFCCCCSGCNLQINCLVIGMIMIIIGIIGIWNSGYYMPQSCTSYLKYSVMCDQYEADGHSKSTIGAYRVVFIMSFIFGAICCLAAGVTLIVAILSNLAVVAFIAAIILLVTIIPVITYHVSYIVYVDKWPNLITYNLNFQNQQDTDSWQTEHFRGAVFFVILLPFLILYFAFCAFQFHKQLNVEVHSLPHRKPWKRPTVTTIV
ncbi:unnamed protein product [Allacma fusca]|uniref:Uncharacterized protein n=1 Tax=Allacma fusca TaxID=39272 RepID=A0A8J2LX07_9HEXA|nr:unnamed protein product [Allacma fusca]